MSDPIHIELASAPEGNDLIETLARRGLIGELVDAGDHWEVEIRSAREQTQRLLLDVEPTLELWLADHRRPAVTVCVGQRSYTLTRGAREQAPSGQAAAGRFRSARELERR